MNANLLKTSKSENNYVMQTKRAFKKELNLKRIKR